MNQHILLFRFYVIISFSFLIPLLFFISVELYKLVKIQIFVRFNININQLHLVDLTKNNIKLLVNIYINRKKWFIVISLLELSELFNLIDSIYLYNMLAYVYQNLSYLRLAEYYYFKALLNQPNNISVLNNLASLYDFFAENKKALEVYRRILVLDNNYVIPKNYISQI